MRSAAFLTDLGRITVLYSSRGICRLVLPEIVPVAQDYRDVHEFGESPEYIAELGKWLIAYSKGFRVKYSFPLDLSGTSEFYQKVWNIVISIPYGKVESYGWVAKNLGNPASARVVGQALARNPIPLIIPCHRVINSNGTPGGFAGRMSSIATKIKLLSLEGYTFR
ncbi:MAG: MGMT family protein [Dehalococcoidia bacterium]|nr:MAG: MGMT family protein [Dehalococcoidia bacterium]